MINVDDLNRLVRELKRHIDDPHTFVLGGICFRA
jgi:hypothetical protein